VRRRRSALEKVVQFHPAPKQFFKEIRGENAKAESSKEVEAKKQNLSSYHS